MDSPPSDQKLFLSLRDNFHRAPHVATFHAFGPNQFGAAVAADEIDFDLPIPEHVNVRGFVVVDENDNAQALRAKYCDHNRQ
jgi:hypothetical protein